MKRYKLTIKQTIKNKEISTQISSLTHYFPTFYFIYALDIMCNSFICVMEILLISNQLHVQ